MHSPDACKYCLFFNTTLLDPLSHAYSYASMSTTSLPLSLLPANRRTQAVHSLLPFLRPGGLAIITLKFTGTGHDRSAHGALLRDL